MTSTRHADDTRFEAWLMRETGIDASSLGTSTLARAVGDRMAHHSELSTKNAAARVHGIDAYWNLLNASQDERQALIETLVVPETWFFRDHEAFAALARLAHARLAQEPARPLRILSVPCSTGEEPYSIAMALLDAGIDFGRFGIDAIDISARAIAYARDGIYGRNSFRGDAIEFRSRHFSKKPDGWLLGERARAPVQFIQANLFDLPSVASTLYDFVFCRNVLIYFGREAQDQAIRLLDAQLAAGGTLFVGSAETGLMMRHPLASARIPLAFAFHRAPPARAEAAGERNPAEPRAGLHSAKTPALRAAPPAPKRPARAPIRNSGRPATAGSAPAGSLATLDDAKRLADVGQLGEAERIAQRHALDHGPDAEAFYLLGLIADARGLANDAQDLYRKTLYLDPNHYEALTHLAVLIDAVGDTAGAARMMDRARRVLAQRKAAAPDSGNTHRGAHEPRR
ncbi:MAG: CheR family methyltransferase [Bordetella sp.]|uniref:CheR family methyltransferase n=1 Tax=Bordetella sp. TaxID=28081 RepID=UPI003F7BD648